MNGHPTSRTSLLARIGGALAIAASLSLVLSPSTARAADGGQTTISEQQLLELRGRITQIRQAATRPMAEVLVRALQRSAQARHHAESLVEDVMTAEPTASSEPSEPAPRRRFEYSTDTDDPLAGLF